MLISISRQCNKQHDSRTACPILIRDTCIKDRVSCQFHICTQKYQFAIAKELIFDICKFYASQRDYIINIYIFQMQNIPQTDSVKYRHNGISCLIFSHLNVTFELFTLSRSIVFTTFTMWSEKYVNSVFQQEALRRYHHIGDRFVAVPQCFLVEIPF